MNAKKALKKLKKQTKKLNKQNENIQKLKNLQKTVVGKRDNKSQLTKSNPRLSAFKKELSEAANQAIVNVAYELATPLKPLLSWFNHDGMMIDMKNFVPNNDNNKDLLNLVKTKNDQVNNKVTITTKSITHLPLKSPPCKRCPALQNGICKCAAKRFKKSA